MKHPMRWRRRRTRLQYIAIMSIPGIPLTHAPSALEQYKTLIRHVHGEPVMIRRAMRIAFRSLSSMESIELRDWLEARYNL